MICLFLVLGVIISLVYADMHPRHHFESCNKHKSWRIGHRILGQAHWIWCCPLCRPVDHCFPGSCRFCLLVVAAGTGITEV